MLAQPFHFPSHLCTQKMKGILRFLSFLVVFFFSTYLQFSSSVPAQRNNIYQPDLQKTSRPATNNSGRSRMREKWRKRSSYVHNGYNDHHHYHWTTTTTPMTTTQPQETDAERKVREKATLFVKALPLAETEQAFNSTVYLFSDAVLAVANITGDFMQFPLTLFGEVTGVVNEVVKQVFYKPVVGFLSLTPLKGLDGAIRGFLALNGITITPDPQPTMMPSTTTPPLTAPHENSLNHYNHHHYDPVHNYEYLNYK